MSMDEKEYKKVCEFESYLDNVCSHTTKIVKTKEGEYIAIIRYNSAIKKFFQNAKNLKRKLTRDEAKAIVKCFASEKEYNLEFN